MLTLHIVRISVATLPLEVAFHTDPYDIRTIRLNYTSHPSEPLKAVAERYPGLLDAIATKLGAALEAHQ